MYILTKLTLLSYVSLSLTSHPGHTVIRIVYQHQLHETCKREKQKEDVNQRDTTTITMNPIEDSQSQMTSYDLRKFMLPFSPVPDPAQPLFKDGVQTYFPTSSTESKTRIGCEYRIRALVSASNLARTLVFGELGIKFTARGLGMSDGGLADQISQNISTDDTDKDGGEAMIARLKAFERDMEVPIIIDYDLKHRRWGIYEDRPTHIHLDDEVSATLPLSL